VLGVASDAKFTKKAHADLDFVTQDSDYAERVKRLAGSDVYFASCRPTLRHILAGDLPAKPTVVGGMFYPGNWPPTDVNDPYYNYYSSVYGFVSYDFGIVPKWLDLLLGVFSAIGQTCTQIRVLTDSRDGLDENPGAGAIFREIRRNKPDGVDNIDRIAVDDLGSVNDALKNFKNHHYPGAGLIVPALTLTADNRNALIGYINDLNLPAVYPNELYVNDGGLISLGVDLTTLYQESGKLVGKLLQGDSITPGLTLWTADVSKFVRKLNLDTASNVYHYDSAAQDRLALLAQPI
jgi:hypothetical protein